MAKKKVKKSKSSEKFELSYLNKISKLSLENFKGFSNKAKLEFSPGINLIYGINSSGKSSIIQAIRLLKQSLHILNSPCPFHLVVPSYMRISGSLTFPEGFLGIINKKDLSKDLTIGIGSYGRGYISKKRKYRRERFIEHIFSNKNNKKFPDIKQINIDKKELFEDSNSLKNEPTFLNLVFKKKQKFKKDKLAKLLTDVWSSSQRRGGGYNVLGLLKFYKDKASNISEHDLCFQFLDIKNSKFNFGTYDAAYNKIMSDLKKYRNSINKNIDFGMSEPKGLSGHQITQLLKKGKSKKMGKTFFNAGEFSYIGRSKLKSLKNFVNSKGFTDKKKFKNFFYKDFKKKLNFIRFRDIFFDIGSLETNYKGDKNAVEKGMISPPEYLIYCHDLILNSIGSPHLKLQNIYENTNDDLRYAVDQISVVPGLRQLPIRYLRRGLEESFVGEHAENLGDILSKKSTKNQVNEWFDKFEIPYHIDTKLVGNFYELIMKPKSNKSFNLSYRDVGLGYSLSLPLIITAIISNNSVILCEEPELHLHPKMQAALMELFMYSALVNKNQFIIETHSENLLLRAQKIIRKGININKKKIPVKSDYINIINISTSNESGSETQKINLDAKGVFKTHWKDGFFADRLDELF